MAESYDHLQESGEPKELGAKVQLAGDVVPLPMSLGGDVSKTGPAGTASQTLDKVKDAVNSGSTNIKLMPVETYKSWKSNSNK